MLSAIAFCAPATWSQNQSSPQELESARIAQIHAMIDRGKLTEAELLIRERLSDPQLSPASRSTWMVEQLRVMRIQAFNAAPNEQEAIWSAMQRDADQYLDRHRRGSRRLIVQLQAATIPAGKAWLALVTSTTSPMEETPRKWIRNAIRELHQTQDQITNTQRNRQYRQPDDDNLSGRELNHLAALTALELARALLTRAQLYSANSEDTALAASEAAKQLEQIAPTAVSDAVWVDSRLDLLAALRWKRDWKRFRNVYGTMTSLKLGSTAKIRLHCELMRAFIGRQDWKGLQRLVANGPAVELDSPDTVLTEGEQELSLTLVESYLKLATADRSSTEDWVARAASLIDQQRSRAPRLFLRRADAYMARSAKQLPVQIADVDEHPTDSDGAVAVPSRLTLQVQAADALYRQGKWRESLDQLDAAIQTAVEAKRPQWVADVVPKGAAILVKQQRTHEAIERLRDFAIQFPESPPAATAHLMATKLAAEQFALAPTDEVLIRQYQALLDESLVHWPQLSQADQIHHWRASLYRERHQVRKCLNDCLKIRPHYRLYPDVLAVAEECYQSGEMTRESKVEGIEFFLQVCKMPAERVTEEAQHQAALSATRLAIETDSSVEQTARQLERYVGRMPEDSLAYDQAQWALAIAWQKMGDRSKVQQCLAHVKPLPVRWLSGLAQFAKLRQRSDRPAARDAAKWQSQLFDQRSSMRQRLSPPQRDLWDQLYGQALLDAGRAREAVAVFRQLVESHPDDGRIYLGLAQSLSDCDNPDWELALQAWRTVARRSRDGQPNWFAAKYGIANSLHHLGEDQRAAEMIRILQALYPKMGGSPMKQDFIKLLRQIDDTAAMSDE